MQSPEHGAAPRELAMSRALPYPFFSPYPLPGQEDEVQGPEVTDVKSTQQMAELGFDLGLLAAKFLMGLSKPPWIILSSGPDCRGSVVCYHKAQPFITE